MPNHRSPNIVHVHDSDGEYYDGSPNEDILDGRFCIHVQDLIDIL